MPIPHFQNAVVPGQRRIVAGRYPSLRLQIRHDPPHRLRHLLLERREVLPIAGQLRDTLRCRRPLPPIEMNDFVPALPQKLLSDGGRDQPRPADE